MTELAAIVREFGEDPLAFAFITPEFSKGWRILHLLECRAVMAREAMRLRSRQASGEPLPEQLANPEKDPFFGRPLRYERTEKGFRLSMSADPQELKSRWGIDEPVEWRCPR